MKSIGVWRAWAGCGCAASRATVLNRSAHHARTNGYTLRLAGVVSLLAFGLPLAGSAAPRQQLSGGHVPAAVARLVSAGSLPGSQRLNLAIALPLRNQDTLTNLLHQLYDPASPKYHRYLTPEQFTEEFGPTEADYQALIAFAKQNGLAVANTHSNRVLLSVNVTVADIERIFHVTMRTYRHPKEARDFYAPNVEPSVDLAVPLLCVVGLNNYVLPQPMSHKAMPPAVGSLATPCSGSATNGLYMGYDYRAAYVPGTSLTGAGQIVGLLQLDGYFPSDIAQYASQAGLPSVPLTNVFLDEFNGVPGSGNFEVSLDIENVISMAPGLSKIIVYEAPNGFPTAALDILHRMAMDNQAKQLSSSWMIGDSPAFDQVYLQFALQGQSFFQASGDYDAYYPEIEQWADDPYITLVGGTELVTSGPRGSWVSETVWNFIQLRRGLWRWGWFQLPNTLLASGHQYGHKPGLNDNAQRAGCRPHR